MFLLFQVIPGEKKKCLEKLMEDMDEHYTQRVSEIGVDVIHWDPLATSEKMQRM